MAEQHVPTSALMKQESSETDPLLITSTVSVEDLTERDHGPDGLSLRLTIISTINTMYNFLLF
jgi:hypothetical protein